MEGDLEVKSYEFNGKKSISLISEMSLSITIIECTYINVGSVQI